MIALVTSTTNHLNDAVITATSIFMLLSRDLLPDSSRKFSATFLPLIHKTSVYHCIKASVYFCVSFAGIFTYQLWNFLFCQSSTPLSTCSSYVIMTWRKPFLYLLLSSLPTMYLLNTCPMSSAVLFIDLSLFIQLLFWSVTLLWKDCLLCLLICIWALVCASENLVVTNVRQNISLLEVPCVQSKTILIHSF